MADLYDPDLLPTLREMRTTWSGPTINLWGFINFKGSLELGYGFASLFWPSLIEVNGGLFVAEQFSSDSFNRWMESLDGDVTRVESVMNHVHVNDLFLNSPADSRISPCVHERFAMSLAGCWRAAAANQFPHFPVEVSCDTDQDRDAMDYVVTLYVKRDTSTS